MEEWTVASAELRYTVDKFGRPTNTKLYSENGNKQVLGYTYAYTELENGTTTSEGETVYDISTRVQTYTSVQYLGDLERERVVYTYTYDANGNITQILERVSISTRTSSTASWGAYTLTASYTTSYVYDDIGQLIRENNQKAGKTYVYTYDEAGNILTKKTYAYTTGTLGTATTDQTYTYGDEFWKDLLTKVGDTTITYDTIGNPTSMTTSEGTYTLTWEQGRQLASISYTGFDDSEEDFSLTFRYNADGLRVYKYHTNSYDETTEIFSEYDGTMLVRETYYTGAEGDMNFYRNVYYLYDQGGSPFGMRVVDASKNSYYYFYEKNLQGDVVAVLNEEGYTLASYTYDAWGNVLSTTYSSVTTGITSTDIAHSKLNPFRYRGYYYDSETGWCYLQSRYYNPSWGRFINADALVGIGGILSYNAFAYCLNNPVNFCDHTGFCTCETGNDTLGIDCINCQAGKTSPPPAPVATQNSSGASVLSQSSYYEYEETYKEYLYSQPLLYQDLVLSGEVDHYYGAKVVMFTNEKMGSYQVLGTIHLETHQLKPKFLNHEYGHYLQEQQLGSVVYLFGIALPSVTTAGIDLIFDIPTPVYHSMPWEYTANVFGNTLTDFGCIPEAAPWGIGYYIFLNVRRQSKWY